MIHKYASKKVLVAVRREDLHIVFDALGTEFNVVVCHTLEDGLAQLDENVALIVCGVHFDEGRIFDFLLRAKQNPKTMSIPFSVVLGSDACYSQAIINGIQSAAEILGASRFTDFSKLKREVGEVQAYEEIRQRIRKIISSESHLQQVVAIASDRL